jgi:hypothetical protein
MVDEYRVVRTLDYTDSRRNVYQAFYLASKRIANVTRGARSDAVIEAKVKYHIELGSPQLHIAIERLEDHTRVRIEISSDPESTWDTPQGSMKVLELLMRQVHGEGLRLTER